MFFGNTSSGVSITVAFLLIARTPMILKENKNRQINYNGVVPPRIELGINV